VDKKVKLDYIKSTADISFNILKNLKILISTLLLVSTLRGEMVAQ